MKYILVAILLSTAATSAFAQSAPSPVENNRSNNAVSLSSDNNTARPAAGANSFTEDEARSRIEAKGYTKVSALIKDSQGVWRGTGMKGDAAQDVALDYQGNVFAK